MNDSDRSLTAKLRQVPFINWFKTGVLIIAVFSAVQTGLAVRKSYQNEQLRAESTTRHLAKAMEETVTGIIEKSGLALYAVSDEVIRQAGSGGINDRVLTDFMARHQSRLREVVSLRGIDAQGIVRYGMGITPGSLVDLSDRDFYRYARDNAEQRLHIARPVFARISKKWVLPVALRLNRPDGSFIGVAYTNISLDYLNLTLSAIGVGEHGAIGLFDSEHKIITRFPEMSTSNVIGNKYASPQFEAMVKTGQTAGTYRGPSAVDGVERVFSFRKIADYPLYVIVGLAEADYLSEWRNNSVETGLLLGVFLLVTLIALGLIDRYWKGHLQSAEALRISEERFRSILDNVPTVAVQGYAPDGTVFYWNRANEPVYGYSADETIGRNLLDLIIPLEMKETVREAIRIGGETGEMPAAAELSLMRKDGSLVPVFSSHAVVRIPGREPELFCIDVDLSELKRAEEARREIEEIFELFLEYSPIYIFFKDEKIRSLRLSRNYETLLGKPLNELLGRTMDDLFPSELAKSMIADDQRVLREGVPVQVEESFNGRIYSTLKFPIIHEGHPSLLAGFTIDITDRKESEEKIRRFGIELEKQVKVRTAELERLNCDLEDFCYAISHEMRAPIARLEGFSKMLSEINCQGDPEEMMHCVARIEVAGQRLRLVVDNLLMMSRLTRSEMTASAVDLSSMAHRLIPELLAESAERRVRIDIAPGIVAIGDCHMLEICLQNLLGNAVKYTSRIDEPRISFGMETRSGETVYYVSDNGAGFDMEGIKNLFQPFCRLHTEKEFEGTGIGLATVKRIIDRHGGRIWAESSPGKGATFYFTLGNNVNGLRTNASTTSH